MLCKEWGVLSLGFWDWGALGMDVLQEMGGVLSLGLGCPVLGEECPAGNGMPLEWMSSREWGVQKGMGVSCPWDWGALGVGVLQGM